MYGICDHYGRILTSISNSENNYNHIDGLQKMVDNFHKRFGDFFMTTELQVELNKLKHIIGHNKAVLGERFS